MLPRLLACSSFVLLVAFQVPTQARQISGQGKAAAAVSKSPDNTARELLKVHLALVQELYELSSDETEQLRTKLTPLIPAQQLYEEGVATTLRRLRVARTVVAGDGNLTDAERAAKIARFEKQYRRLVAEAPLSIAHMADLAEAMLSKERVTAVKARIKARLAGRIKDGSAALDGLALEAALSGPIPPAALSPMAASAAVQPVLSEDRESGQSLEIQTPPPTRVAPGDRPLSRAAKRDPASARPARTPRSPTKRPPVVKRPPPKPAPPESEWAKYPDKAGAEFGFTDQQKETAKTIFESCRQRAAAHHEQRKADYDAAGKIADTAERAKKIRDLDGRLDSLYDELTRRIDALASFSQRQRAGKGATGEAGKSPEAQQPAKGGVKKPQPAAKPATKKDADKPDADKTKGPSEPPTS